MSDSALVLLSGGQDSTVCLAWTLERFEHVETIGFDYAQRHAVELQTRLKVRERIGAEFPAWAGRLGPDYLLDMSTLGAVSDTALTQAGEIRLAESGLPNTFVPGRNLLFFTYAAAVAYRRGLKRLVGGMCETDYSGYPDCRDDALKALQVALNLGMDSRFVVETPLMWIDKAETWALTEQLGGEALVDHSCYLGDREHRHAWGYGCGGCPACDLRRNGFEKWRSEKISSPAPAGEGDHAQRGDGGS